MKAKQILYISTSILCIILATIGIVVPGLPTTPLLLAASWMLYRSSPRLQRWLLSSPLGVYIRDYQRRGGMRIKTKVWVVTLMLAMVTCSVVFFIDTLWVDCLVVALGLVGSLVVIFKVPNANEEKDS